MSDNNSRSALVELGRSYQPEFVESMADQAFTTATDWLREHGVPQEILTLLDAAIILQQNANDMKHGSLKDDGAAYTAEYIPLISKCVWVAGGEFSAGASVYRGEDRLDWKNDGSENI